jgi:haloacetate dehalogenase
VSTARVPPGRMATANGIRIHYLLDGDGPPLVLLHGWPQTSYMWRLVMPLLAERHTVVAPDLRGYGQSDAPRSGYDKRTMAEDIRSLVRGLGHRQVTLVGHDRGARIAHRYALDHPDEVRRLVVLDIVPTREVLRRMDAELAVGYWHWLFHMQPELPELLVGDKVAEYLGWFFQRWAHRPGAIDRDAVDHYVAAFSNPVSLRAGFEDYRATLADDAPADDRSAEDGRRLPMPLLALWGGSGLVDRLPVRDIWTQYADDVQAEAIPDCGHFLAEEQPQVVVDRILAFVGRTSLPAGRNAAATQRPRPEHS